MDDRNPGRVPRPGWLALALVGGLLLALGPAVAATPSGATIASTGSGSVGTSPSLVAASKTALTLDQWKQRYEHDVGILADDVLVVVDDGKRAQTHDTAAKVKTTLQDCRQWAKDAAIAPTAAPPIPLPAAERAWKNMMRASALAAAQCVAALQRRSLTSARNFRKQLAIVEKNEATLVKLLGG
jgi:hypothetical protein